MTANASAPDDRSAELLGELARRLSALVRRDVDVSAAEQLPTLRRVLLDAAAVCVVAVAGLFALGAATVGAGIAVASALPGWAAALVVGGAWTLVALLAAAALLRPRARPHERQELVGLLQMLARDHRLDELQSSRERSRDEAEAEMRQAARALVETLLAEATEHQVRALPAVAKREVGKAEADAAELIAEAIALLTAPARAAGKALGLRGEPREDDHSRSGRSD